MASDGIATVPVLEPVSEIASFQVAAAATESAATAPRMTPERAALVLGEQVRTQYQSMPTSCMSSVVMSTLVLVIMKDVVSHWIAAGWLAAIYGQGLARFWLWRTYFKRSPPPAEAQRWGRYAVIGSATVGAMWGVGVVLLFPPGLLEYQLVLLFVLLGMGSGSVYASVSYMPAFNAFLYPTFVPVGVMLLMHGGVTHTMLGGMAFVFVFVLTRFASNLNRAFCESLMLRFENVDLVGQLRVQKDAAERANTAKSRFLAAASHDLRQPVHALSLYVDRLQDDVLPQAQQKIVERVARSVHALRGLFDALLDISRLDGGMVAVSRSHFPLADVLDRIRTDYTPLAADKGLRLAVVNSRCFIETDMDSFERILRNLVHNAVSYTTRGGVVVGCRRRGAMVRVQVWDSGPGIPEDKHDDIFLEFYQLGNQERDRRKGLGLGLAIVDRLTRLLGHRLMLSSRVGRGSVFSIDVPAGHAAQWQPAPSAEEHEAQRDFGRALIAVVDDEVEIQDAMRTLLEHWNCAVVTASSRAEIIARLGTSEGVPDLLICDFRLRDGDDGLSVIARLREEFNTDIPALLVTGDTAQKAFDIQDGITQVMHKPLQPARLRSAMSRLMRGAQEVREAQEAAAGAAAP